MTTTYDQSTVTYDQSSLTYQGVSTLFDGISFAVEMAFGYEPLDPSPQWEVVTAYVRGFDINRGRNSEFTTYGPGTVSIALDNRDRRFDPEHTSGPYFGDLNPMVPVRVQATYSGVTYTMFYGFVQGWPTAYNQSNTDAVTSITAIDGTRLLGNIPLPENPFRDYMETFIGVLYNSYWPFQYVNEVVADAFTQDQPTQVSEVNIGGIVNASRVRGNSATTYNSLPSAVSFWVVRNTNDRLNQQVIAVGAESTSPSYRSLIDVDIVDDFIWVGVGLTNTRRITASTGIALDRDQSLQHIVVTQTELYLNGVSRATWSLGVGSFPGSKNGGNPLYINTDKTNQTGRIAHVSVGYGGVPSAAQVAEEYARGSATFSGELSSARLGRVLDDAGWPTSWRDVETGVQPVGSYRPAGLAAVRYMDQIGNAEQGALFVNREGEVEFRSRSTADAVQVVGLFDDSGTDLPFANVSVDSNTVDAIRNRVTAQYAYETVSAVDTASVAAYGEASESLDLQLVEAGSDAQSIVDARLARAKDPRTRITRLDVKVRRDPAGLVPVVAALDLSDDVTVSLTPTGVGSALWRAVRVQGLSHTVTPQSWDVSLYLAPGPVNTNGPLMILDDAVYGELDANKLG